MIAGIRDPNVIANLDQVTRRAEEAAFANLDGVDPEKISVTWRAYGRDAVLGERDPDRSRTPHEIGLLIDVVAETQDLANAVLAMMRSSALHCPFEGRTTTAGNLAFPYSPSDLVGGPVYEFSAYHLMEVEDPVKLFPYDVVTLGARP